MECRNIKLEDLGLKLGDVNVEGKFCNWYNNVIFEHKGKPYVVFVSFKAPGFSGKNEISISMGNGSPKFGTQRRKTSKAIVPGGDGQADTGFEDILIVEDPDMHIVDLHIKPSDAFKQQVTGDSVLVRLGDTSSMVCQVGKWKLKSTEGDFDVDLVFTARGPVVWWGGEPNVPFNLTMSTIENGFEAMCDVSGHIVYKGERMDVRGKGVHEHVWIEKLDMMELRYVDYVIMNFDQAYFMFYNGESAVPERSLAHYQAGNLCLLGENRFLPLNKITVEPTRWAYSPSALRFIPVSNKMTLETPEGILSVFAEPLISPTFVTIRRMENARFFDIPGWGFYYWDAPYKASGRFTYNDGRVVELTNGIGINEPQRVSPLT